MGTCSAYSNVQTATCEVWHVITAHSPCGQEARNAGSEKNTRLGNGTIIWSFITHFPHFGRMKVSLWDHVVSLSACESQLSTFECLHQPLRIWYVTWTNFNYALKKSFSVVIPTLQPLKFLKQNVNIAWTPVQIFMKLMSCHMKPHKRRT